MIREACDVAIVGAGFAGSIMALVLQRSGLKPVLLERGAHPRFAIGESSTPLANLALEELGRAYDLPQLVALSEYGRWQKAYPKLACGLKRGFSYFTHKPDQPFLQDAVHSNELLVAASPADEVADTHWFREHIDAFFAEQAQKLGIPYFDRTEITTADHRHGWKLQGRRGESAIEVNAKFLIDATGPGGFLPRILSIDTKPDNLRTHCWSVYTHFEGVALWEDVLRARGADLTAHPFPCDAAALHHLVEEGWIWVLRFNNGITSAGIAFDGRLCSQNEALTPEQEWRRILVKYPSIGEHFRDACPVQPWVRTGRLQRLAKRAAGLNWALLPHAAYFLDPFFSAGNAHTLHGIQRLARILTEHWQKPSQEEHLFAYEELLKREIDLVDKLVHGSYRAFRHFDVFTGYAMHYFAAAHTCETRRRNGLAPPGSGFLLADDPIFCAGLDQSYKTLLTLTESAPIPRNLVNAFHQKVAQAIGPFNTAGLADPTKLNMYPFVG
jgi:tetracycline 7-halogenase / FADH2 O2-dependent halogenase